MGLPSRLGVITDLHANFEAMKVTVNWLHQHGIERIVCLGDIVGYNANPLEVTYLTHQRVEFSLKGNHERYVLGHRARGVREEKLEVIDWTREQLSESYLRWLESLPDAHLFEGSVLLVHGSPRDPDEYVYRSETFKSSLQHMAEHYKGIRLCFFGHSHLPMCISRRGVEASFPKTRTIPLERGETYLINPGSVGQPRDGVAKAAFGVMDFQRYAFTWVRLDYDYEATGVRIRDMGLDAGLATRLARGK
ncbi:MAG: metallophosphoesterase [Planctomycetota bacterium]|nr:MAG: metallophosphoesterase [Planctomycetota bacterium]